MNTEDLFIDPRSLLKKYGLRAKKAYSQNFLVSKKAVETIARSCVPRPGVHVVEIGAGLGTLTHALLILGARVTAVEKDPDMCSVLQDQFQGHENLLLMRGDASDVDFSEALGETKGVLAGNLPYQITGLIFRRLLERSLPLEKAVFMVQLEVARRLCAAPGSRTRGALTVMLDAAYEARTALTLKPTAFAPPPKVRSAVVELVPRTTPIHEGLEIGAFQRVVKAAFAAKRKTIKNSLSQSGLGNGEQVARILERAQIDPGARAEHLETETFAALARVVIDHRPLPL